MRSILECIYNYIIVVDKTGKIIFCNEKLLAKLKYIEDEIEGINIDNLINIGRSEIHYIIENIKTGQKENIDINITTKYKEDVPLNCDVMLDIFENKECIFIIGKDLNEKYYDRQILEKALDTLPYSIWIKDLEGKFKYVNKYKADELNLNKHDFLDKHDKEFYNNKTYNFFKSIDDEVIVSKRAKSFKEVVKKEDNIKWFETYKAPILDDDGNTKFTIASSTNTTIIRTLIEEAIINNQVIKQIKNIIEKQEYEVQSHNIIENIGEELYRISQADNVTIFKYDKKRKFLENIFEKGIKKNNYDKKIYFLNENQIENIKNNKKLEGVKNIKDIETQSIKNMMISNNMNYYGCYKIMNEDEFLGFISVTYFRDNSNIVIVDDFIKSMCEYIGLYMINQELVDQVSSEIERRVDTEKQVENLLEISVDTIVKIMNNGKIIKVNNKWPESLGWSEDELIKKNILEIIHEDYINDLLVIMKEQDEIYDQCISKVLCKGGSYKIFSWNYKTLPKEGHIILAGKDITKQREEEEKRRKLEEEIKLESFKNEFFTNLSHEFKTPLNIILGSIQLITRKIELENLPLEIEQKYINAMIPMKQNSYRLLRLVNNLIDITKIDSGYYQIQLGNYNIVNIVENITLSVVQYIEHKGINLTFDTNCEEKIIACDPDKIERIILNLLSNAIKYTKENGDIFVDLKVYDKKVYISVKDNGTGIEKDKLDEIFERFKQVDNILTRRCEGSGIGLALTKSLVELHNGKIYVDSNLGKGTEFTIELPITLVEHNDKDIVLDSVYIDGQIEKCNIEFSDIYI